VTLTPEPVFWGDILDLDSGAHRAESIP